MKLKDIIAAANEALKVLAGKRFQGPDGMNQFHQEKSNILGPIAREARVRLNMWSFNDRGDDYRELFDIVLEFKDDNMQSIFRRGRVIGVTIRQKYECSPEATLDQYIRLIKMREADDAIENSVKHLADTKQEVLNAEKYLAEAKAKREGMNKPDDAEFWATVTQGLPSTEVKEEAK